MARFRPAVFVPAAASLLGALVLFSPSLLGGPAAGREDDVDFAMALMDRGYEDLARAEVDRMPKGEQADYILCQLLRKSALIAASNPKTPPQEVRTKFDEVRKAFDGYLKSYPAAKHRSDAELSMSNLMKDFAYYLTTNLEKFEVKERAGVQDEAGKIFDDAITYLVKIKDREQAKDDPLPPDDPDKFENRNRAWYFLCVAMHDRAMLKPPGDAVRLQQFTAAIEETKLFLEETDGYYFGFLASDRVGLAYWHRAEMQKGWNVDDIKIAREYFSGALVAMDAENIEEDNPDLVVKTFEAAVNYGKMCNQVGNLEGVNYPKLFHDEVAKIAEKLPSVRTRQAGLMLLIEDAKAMATIGAAEQAITRLNEIGNLAKDEPTWGRTVDQAAKRALNEILASIPSDSAIQIAPPVLFKAAEGSLRERSFGRAIRTYQRVLSIIDAELDPARRKVLSDDLGLQCWTRIYECYYQQDRFLEAFAATDFPVQRFLNSGAKEPPPEVAQQALNRIYPLEKLLAKAPKDQKPELLERLKAARELYTSRFQQYADQADNVSVSYAVASQKVKDAKSAVAGGDATRSAALFTEAIDLFKKVDAKDAIYGTAQARIGECLVQMGKPEDAIKHLEAFIKKNMGDWTNTSTPAAQKQPWGIALFWMASAYEDLKQFPKVIECLDGFETKFQGATLDSFFPQVRAMRIAALVRSTRGDEASAECDRLMKDSPDTRFTVTAVYDVANDLKVRSDRSHKEGNKKAEIELKKRSLPYFEFFLAHAANVGADNYTFVGSLHFEVESFARAAELWSKALELFKKQGDDKMVYTLTVNITGLLVGQGKYAEALPQFEILFIKTPELADLREAFSGIRSRPGNVAVPVWDKRMKDLFDRIADVLAKDADGSARAGEAKKVAAGGDIEVLVRAYSDSPEMRRALARATALTVLGSDAALPPDMRNAAFTLVKRSPELLGNIARCYEELATASPENAIRAVNIYALLIETSPNADDPENPAPGTKYSERWFDWKYHWVKVYLTTGKAYKERGEAWLKMVCGIVKSMGNLGEIERADKTRADLGKGFTEMKDAADAALRGIGKEGCQ